MSSKNPDALQKPPNLQFYKTTRWPEVLPNYGIKLEQALEEAYLPSYLYLHGNYMGGIGLSRLLERASELPHILQK